MFGLGYQELLLILVIVLVLFGGSKLPDLAKSLGKSMKEFVRSMDLMSTKVFPHLRHLEPPPRPDSL